MFRFKLSNNNYVNELEIDGYTIAGIAFEGINIKIKIDENKNIISYLEQDDIKILDGFNYEHFLTEAKELSKTYIINKDFSIFSLPKKITVLDILDKNNNSFYWFDIIKKEKQVTFHIRLLNASNLIQNAYLNISRFKI